MVCKRARYELHLGMFLEEELVHLSGGECGRWCGSGVVCAVCDDTN